MSWAQLQPALPEIYMALAAMALLMLGAFARKSRSELILWLAVLLLAVAAFFAASGSRMYGSTLSGVPIFSSISITF